jgi:hypothetical protein
MANPSVGRALERVTGPGSVLDVAALAAPSFVEVCLGQPTHAIEIGGERFAVVQVTVGEEEGYHRTFRSHFGHLAPVAVIPADESEMACCPGRDFPWRPETGWRCSAPPTSSNRSGIEAARAVAAPRVTVPLALKIRRRLRALMGSNAKGLVLSL